MKVLTVVHNKFKNQISKNKLKLPRLNRQTVFEWTQLDRP